MPGNRIVLVFALLAVLAGGWLWWLGGGPDAPESPMSAGSLPPTDPVATAPRDVASHVPAEDPATGQRTEALPTVEPERPAAAEHREGMLTGRCVDADGNPIAGVVASLTGWPANSERMAAWRKDHPEPERLQQKQTTGVDGRFAFRFWPPPPFQFFLTITATGRATLQAGWGEIAPGATVDLGDVVLGPGAQIQGRVVEADGRPVPRIDVRLQRSERLRSGRDDRPAAIDFEQARTREDGTFATFRALPPGEYRVEVPPRHVARPATVTVTGAVPPDVEVVLEPQDPTRMLQGIVREENGEPVRGVELDGWRTGGGTMVYTDRAGRFQLERPKTGSPDEVSLRLRKDGFEMLEPAERFRWGRDDLSFTMQRALAVEVLVVADDSGQPVEDFALRIWPRPGTQRIVSSADSRVRSQGRHPGGRAVVPGIVRGEHLVAVEPAGDDLAAGPLVPLVVGDRETNRVTVRLPRQVQRTVRVESVGAAPVVGVPVQLVDPRDQPVRAGMPTARFVDLIWGGGGHALRLQEATTDDAGQAVLRGPAGVPLAVVLPGPGHMPHAVGDVRLDEPDPLVVTVGRGGGLQGRIGPAAVLRELRRLAALPEQGPVEGTDRGYLPSVQLERSTAEGTETHPRPRDPSATLDEEGGFHLAGVPPGTWTVQVMVWRRSADGSGSGGHENVGTAEVRDGETTTVEIDLTEWIPGDLDGLVLHNGEPLADTALQLLRGRLGSGMVRTDGAGRFRHRGRAGDYTLAWPRPPQPDDRHVSWTAAGTVALARGGQAAGTFHFTTGTVRVRVVDEQGSPIAGVQVMLQGAEPGWFTLPATDADGRAEDLVPVQSFEVVVLPRRLQDPQAQRGLWASPPPGSDPVRAARIRLGTVQPRVGETVTLELRLPPTWRH